MKATTLAVVTLASLTLAGPAWGTEAGAARASCPVFRDARVVGSVRHPALDEISGVVASRSRRLLWVHEDSGNGAWLYGIRPDGDVVSTISVTGATNRDWEDAAMTRGTLWIGDIGDNKRVRSEIQVYRLPEPRPRARSVAATTLRFRYPDGAHDAESLVVDARHKALFVVTKETSGGTAGLYRGSIADPDDGGLRSLERVASIGMAPVTGATRSRQGVVLRTYTQAKLFRWKSDRRVASALGGTGCPVPLGGGESVAYRSSDRRYYSIPEGGQPRIWVTTRR